MTTHACPPSTSDPHDHQPIGRRRRRAVIPLAIVALLSALGLLAIGAAATATPTASDNITGLATTDGSNSSNAARLVDGATGTVDGDSWLNADNRWSNSSYPMAATIDLGGEHTLTSVHFYGGQIPFPANAALTFATSADGSPGSFSDIATVSSPTYDAWSAPIPIGDVDARFVQVRFTSMQAHFNVSEVTVQGRPTVVGPTGGGEITGIVASDGANSTSANRLVDGAIGSGPAVSWSNPTFWDAGSYPMQAELDLGAAQRLDRIEYFVGNLNIGTDRLVIESSTTASGNSFSALATFDGGHVWNDWRIEDLPNQMARRLRLTFESPAARFNLSEVKVFAGPTVPTTPVPSTPVPPTPVPPTPAPPTPVPPTPVPPTPVPPVSGDQPQAGPPPADIVRSHGFGRWPSDHLSEACRLLHDNYWVQGPNAGVSGDPNHPDNMAYHTWHPAIDQGCDFGHEHGTNPTAAGPEVFALSGGWPAFGWAAEHAAAAHSGQMQRHEDHVGHKVTVANFRAAIGNGANRNDTLWDAGFDCTWLSKIHQGSFSLDAFSNHLHEYFLTLQCMDGLNASGQVDNTVVGTEFAVKVMYTYGEPDKFVEENCSQDVPWTAWNDTIFSSSILTGPDGQQVPPAHRTSPVGNNGPNNRAFTCSSGVIWQDIETQVEVVDIWNELIKIERNDGSTGMTIQPYYIVKNPARIIEAYDGIKASAGQGQNYEVPMNVVRTIGICYDETTGARLQRPYCEGAPQTEPDWNSPESPFNGAFRAIHFKSSDLQNGNGPTAWCSDAFGHAVNDQLPCDIGNITQYAASFTNHWNDGQYSYNGRQGNIQGSIRSETPHGDVIEADPRPGGGYFGYRIGYELIIDNRDPDDNFDGIPDGANLRGQN